MIIPDLIDFTQEVAKLLSENKIKLLAKYLSLLTRSDRFRFFSPDIDVLEDELSNLGGSSDEFESFVSKARESAMNVSGVEEIPMHLTGGEPRTDVKVSTVKIPRKGEVENQKEKELVSDEGEEKKVRQDFVGRVDISIENLEVSKQVGTFLNKSRVLALKKEILDRFEPSLLRMTVAPCNIDQFDKTSGLKLENLKFQVLSGRHLLQALREDFYK